MAQGQYKTASPWRFPTFRISGVLLALGCAYLSFTMWSWARSVVEDFYLVQYAKLSLLPNLSKAHYSVGRSMSVGQSYRVLAVGKTIATSATPLSGPVSIQTYVMDPKAFQEWLRLNIYGGQAVTAFARTPLYWSLSFLVVFYGNR